MDNYYMFIAGFALLALLLVIPIMVLAHQKNSFIINQERMRSREIAEALAGKKSTGVINVNHYETRIL